MRLHILAIWDTAMYFTRCLGIWHMEVRAFGTEKMVCIRCGRER